MTEKHQGREQFLPVAAPVIGEDEINEVIHTLRSGWITTGPKTRKFEEEFAEYVGAAHAVAVNSCTAGLHLSLTALNVGPGDEVITSPLTFCSTANTIVHCGAEVVLADIDPATFNIDPTRIGEAVTPRSRVLLPVHFAGQPCEMERILALADREGLAVVEDAAHAVGASWSGGKIGNNDGLASFSFYAIKNLTTAEGGMVTTNDSEMAKRIRILSLHGISADAWKRYSREGSWYYEVLEAGFKYNMTDIQAALGRVQLKRLEDFIQSREKIARIYDEEFGPMNDIRTPTVRPGVRHARHLYPVLIHPELESPDRSGFMERLRGENIGSTVNFIPLYRHPFYQKRFPEGETKFRQTEWVYRRIVSIPLYPAMSEQDALDVVAAVKRALPHSTGSAASVTQSALSDPPDPGALDVTLEQDLTNITRDEILHLTRQHPHLMPFGHYADFSESALDTYFMDTLSSGFPSPARQILAFRKGGRLVGAVGLSHLDWDSRHFGFDAGRADFIAFDPASLDKSVLFRSLLEQSRLAGWRHVHVRIPARALDLVQAAEETGFQLVDGLVTLYLDREAETDRRSASKDVRLAGDEDLDGLMEIARRSFRADRFHKDPSIPGRTADEMHADWVRNSVRGYADAVLVAETNGSVSGFITCKIDRLSGESLGRSIGTIVLVAVASECRGQGVGRKLSQAAVDWFLEQGVQRIEVGTQIDNIAATRTYLSAGFRMIDSVLTMRALPVRRPD